MGETYVRFCRTVVSSGTFGRRLRGAPARGEKKAGEILYVTGILPRGQEMALIFDGFL